MLQEAHSRSGRIRQEQQLTHDGWVGGTGTAAHVTPSTGAVTILLSQLEMAGPTRLP